MMISLVFSVSSWSSASLSMLELTSQLVRAVGSARRDSLTEPGWVEGAMLTFLLGARGWPGRGVADSRERVVKEEDRKLRGLPTREEVELALFLFEREKGIFHGNATSCGTSPITEGNAVVVESVASRG